MKISIVRFVLVVVLSHAYLHCAGAQGVPSGDMTGDGGIGAPGKNVEYLDKLKRDAQDEHREVNTLGAMKQATDYAEKANLACDIVDAAKAGDGSTRMGGKSVNISAYEVACRSGVGYILIAKYQAKPSAVSCFGIASSNDAGDRSGQPSHGSTSMTCLLPENKNINAQAENLLKSLNANCSVNGISSFGVNANNKTEYVEVACTNKVGYVLAIPQQRDAKNQISVMSCQDSARHGLRCRLTDASSSNAPAPVTLQTLGDALEQNGVHCTTPKLRLIGREQEKKRYVVEVQCPEHPTGLIAYIPVNDTTQTFETVACEAASERHLSCQLNSK